VFFALLFGAVRGSVDVENPYSELLEEDAAVPRLAGSSPPAAATFQDVSEIVFSAKTQLSELLDRVGVGNDRLRNDYQAESAKVDDLKLETASLQAQVAREKQKLAAEVELFKQHMVEKIAELQAANQNLENTNLELVAKTDKCAVELETESSKKEVMVKKLKKMGTMFHHQQESVRQTIEQQQSRVNDEITSDVRDALVTAGVTQ